MKSKRNLIIVIIMDILMFFCYFLFYGPFGGFRTYIITTSMLTMEHKYIAHTFYSQKTIDRVMKENMIEDINEDTNDEEIEFTSKEVYDSIYEEQVLKKDPGNDLYKIVDLKGPNYRGYMVVVYDPSRISLASTAYLGYNGQILRNIATQNNAIIAVNASGFKDDDGRGHGGIPTGTVISNGKVIYQGGYTGYPGGLVGFNKDHVLILTKKTPYQAIQEGMVDAVEFGPFLIVNGQKALTKGNGGAGINPRTAIAQRKDGIVLFFVIDGRKPGYSIGISFSDLTELIYKYGGYNAANMDGGASTTLIVNNKLYNKPSGIGGTGERRVPNGWIVK